MLKNLGDWWKSIGEGADAAQVLIDEDLSYVSDDTLYQLAEQSGVPNADAFVESAREDLDSYHERERVKDEGTFWEKFNHNALINEDEHPILAKFLPF